MKQTGRHRQTRLENRITRTVVSKDQWSVNTASWTWSRQNVRVFSRSPFIKFWLDNIYAIINQQKKKLTEQLKIDQPLHLPLWVTSDQLGGINPVTYKSVPKRAVNLLELSITMRDSAKRQRRGNMDNVQRSNYDSIYDKWFFRRLRGVPQKYQLLGYLINLQTLAMSYFIWIILEFLSPWTCSLEMCFHVPCTWATKGRRSFYG